MLMLLSSFLLVFKLPSISPGICKMLYYQCRYKKTRREDVRNGHSLAWLSYILFNIKGWDMKKSSSLFPAERGEYIIEAGIGRCIIAA